MRVKSALAIILAAVLAAGTVSGAPFSRSRTYRQAISLYQNKMYSEARRAFERISPDAVADGYVALCALKLRSSDASELLSQYRTAHTGTKLLNDVLNASATNLFDDENYQDALAEYQLVDPANLLENELPEYYFKRGYCEYTAGTYPEAIASFEKLEALPYSDYTPAGYYLHGIILYNQKRFAEAEPRLSESRKDPRFEELSRFYIIDCEFNRKNYDYAISEGEAMYPDAPKERQEHLARLISESYLVKGNKEKAREYFEGVYHTDLTRSDFFYSGSVLYAVEDYRGAIEQFTRMTDRTDSLGQIANYQLGNAYIRTRNKVAAMESFRDAADADFDQHIKEDALFNYAKLAFDLNKDTGGFAAYIKRYSTKTKGEQIYSYMALADLVDRDYAGAVAAYDNIDELSDDMKANYTKANFLRAEQLIRNGSYSDAVPFLRTCGYYLPKNDRFGQLSRYWLAESYYRAENFKDAERNFLELYNSDALYDLPEGKSLSYNVAYSYLKQDNFDSAAKWFDTYIASGDSRFREDAFNRRADCDFASASYKEAVDSYQRVLDEYPAVDNLYALYRKGMAQGLAGDKKAKIATLSKAESASPKALMYSECLYELGRTRIDLKSYQLAESTFVKLRDTATDNIYVSKALIGLGMVKRNTGKYEEALANYKKVVSLLPGSEYAEESMMAIESIYQTMKHPEKYLEYVEQNSLAKGKSEEDRDKMYFNTAEQVYLAGNYGQAIQTLQKYLDNYPAGSNTVQARFYMAESYKALGEKEKAAECYRQVSESGVETSFSEMSRLNYANLLYSLERFPDAYKAYNALSVSARIDENRTTGYVGMMRSAFRDKNYNPAIAAADQALASKGISDDLRRESLYVKGKSYFSTSRRNEALDIFKTLSANPSTAEGAEARYILMTDAFDKADFEQVETYVYDFAERSGDQTYWLAKAYLLLGDSFVERGKYSQAKATYESIRDGYEPSSSTDDIPDNVTLKLARLAELAK